VEALLEPEFMTSSWSESAPVSARWAVTERESGEHMSSRYGASVEFADYREYQPGDDPRSYRLDASRPARPLVREAVSWRGESTPRVADRCQYLYAFWSSHKARLRHPPGCRVWAMSPYTEGHWVRAAFFGQPVLIDSCLTLFAVKQGRDQALPVLGSGS
jgi:hypothetical protein